VDTFSEKAIEVMDFARIEAQYLQQNYIGSEHILLGLLHQEGSAAVDVIKNFGVELSKVRDELLSIIDRPDRIVIQEFGLAPSSKKAIKLAAAETKRLGKPTIGTISILLGLVLAKDGIAAAVLENHGITPENVRLGALQVLSQRDDS